MPNYVNNSELYSEICESLSKKELTPRALEMLGLIVTNANKRLKYTNPDDKEDCVAFAYMEVVKYWNRFNPDKSKNAFAYFTQMAKNGYAKGWDILHPKRYKGTISMNGSEASPDGIFSL